MGGIVAVVRLAALCAVSALCASGCLFGGLDYNGKQCPCPGGYICDPARNICATQLPGDENAPATSDASLPGDVVDAGAADDHGIVADGGVDLATTARTDLAAMPIRFVQVASTAPPLTQAAQATVSATFSAPQSVGGLNVIAIGWEDTAVNVTAVTDTAGNSYTLAVGPTILPGYMCLSTYYAKNIRASAPGNVVSVTFTTAAKGPDLRILEYSGIDPFNALDVTAAATGTSNISSAGPATTTTANDLLFGANMLQVSSSGPGAGFTSRVITSRYQIAEDRVVSSVGSYNADVPLADAGGWIQHLVAFRGITVSSP
jgi:hypothetical protein